MTLSRPGSGANAAASGRIAANWDRALAEFSVEAKDGRKKREKDGAAPPPPQSQRSLCFGHFRRRREGYSPRR